MQQQFGLIRRPWGVFYLKNKITGAQISLKTRDKAEAQRLLQAQNDAQSQPHFNLALARVYINGADPKLGTRTWQEVMEHIVAKKTNEAPPGEGAATDTLDLRNTETCSLLYPLFGNALVAFLLGIMVFKK